MPYILITFLFLLVLQVSAPAQQTSVAWYDTIEHAPVWWLEKQQGHFKNFQEGIQEHYPEFRDTFLARIAMFSYDYEDIINFTPPYSRITAFDILLNTETFTQSVTGVAGLPSKQSIAFNVILVEPDASEAFLNLFDRAYTAGKLYALCGLRLLDSSLYATKARELLIEEGEVMTVQGCVSSPTPIKKLVQNLDGFRYSMVVDITIQDSIDGRSHLGPVPMSGTTMDIEGGGLPIDLLHTAYILESSP